MSKIILVSFIVFTAATFANAQERTEIYSSVAQSRKGDPAYRERHEVTFKDQRVQKAKTHYLGSDGKPIGEMSSDFSKMITVPEYDYKDLRTGNSHGIRLEDGKITLWAKDKDGKLKSTQISEDKFPKDTLLVGCQGLHYYLVENLERVREKKSIPIVYFIPGKLDYYSFTLKLDREDENFIYLKLSINNLVLKLFTSSLDLKYSKADRRLVQFSGLSNITDDKDQMQNVIIDYKYN